MAQRSPAELYAVVIGAVLVVAGIVGFLYSASFGAPGDVDAVLGILDVNAWHNLVHIATGAAGLLAFTAGAAASRLYALALGAVYLLVAIVGFVYGDGEAIVGLIPVNTEDNLLHLLLGVAGLAAGATSAEARPQHVPTGHSASAS